MNQLRDQAERELSGCNATSDDGVCYDSRFKSSNLTHTVCRELDSVLFERDICQQGSACSDRASNQQFDDDESGSDPELVNLFRTNNSCPRRGHEARQAPPRLTPQNASWSPRPPTYQQSPRPPSLTVDDVQMVAEGNITPDPWEPHTHVPVSIPLRRRDVERRWLPTLPELENCCSPTMDEMPT